MTIVFLFTLLASFALVATTRWHGKWSTDVSAGIQKFHTQPTTRIAGLAIFAGLSLAYVQAPAATAQLLGPMLLASLPAFGFGFLEDITKKVSVRERLLATIASGALAWCLTGVSLGRVDVWGLDTLLLWLPFSVAFTAFAIGGVANSVNIIDGFNGLAGGVVMVCFAAMGWCAHSVGDLALAQVCAIHVAVVFGFWCVNFPFGKIFLGDGGAYLLGFCLGWVAVLLPVRNPSLSPWVGLLVCSYPVFEVLFSMFRRHRRKLNAGHPDRLHMHSLLKMRLVRKRWGHLSGVMQNAAVSPFVWLFAMLPAVLACVFRNHVFALMATFVLCASLYVWVYRRLVKFGWWR